MLNKQQTQETICYVKSLLHFYVKPDHHAVSLWISIMSKCLKLTQAFSVYSNKLVVQWHSACVQYQHYCNVNRFPFYCVGGPKDPVKASSHQWHYLCHDDEVRQPSTSAPRRTTDFKVIKSEALSCFLKKTKCIKFPLFPHFAGK